jgi:uncharacterized protein
MAFPKPDPLSVPFDPASLELRAGPGHTLLRIRVTPKASRNGVLGIAEGALRLRIAAPPVEGAANAEARAYLAKLLGRPKSALVLEKGATGRDKVFRVEGLDPESIQAALRAALA